MDAIECNNAKSTMGAMVGLRKLGNTQADAAGKAAAGPDAGGLSIGRRLVVMVSPQPEGQPGLEEGDFRRASPLRSSRGPTDGAGAGAGAAVKPGIVQVVDHGVNQKEAVRRLFDAHVLVASLEQQLEEKELLIRKLSQQLNKVGGELGECKAQPEQSAKPAQPVLIEVVHETRSVPYLQSAKPAHKAQSAKPARVVQPEKGPSQADKRRIAQEKASQEEAADSGAVRKGFPKWLTADESSRLAIERVWSMMLHDWNEKNTFEKSKVVHNLWQCGFEFAMRWGGDPNELLEEQNASLIAKYNKVQRESQQEIAMLRQHARRIEVQYKRLQEAARTMQERRATAAASPSNKSMSTTGELSREQSAALLSPAAGGKRRSLEVPGSPGPASPSLAKFSLSATSPNGAHGPEQPSAIGEAKSTGNMDIVQDDTLIVNVAQQDLETMDHEVFEAIKNMDADQQEMMIDMVNDKVRRILALDPSKWTDGRLPFGLRPDNTPPDVIKLEAENKHLRVRIREAEEELVGMRAELEAARQVKKPLTPVGQVNKFVFQNAVRTTLSLKGVSRRRGEGEQQVTASDADAKNEDQTGNDDEDLDKELRALTEKELKALRDKVAELEARLRTQQEELSKAKAQASLAQQQLAQKEKELREQLAQKEKELREQLAQKEKELREKLEEQRKKLEEKEKELRKKLEEKEAQLKAERLRAEQAERSKAGTPSTRATTANSSGNAKSFWVEVDQSNGQDMAGAVVSKVGPPPALRVESIDPNGQVAEWNRLNPGEAVAEGDLIVEINGVSGDGDALLRAFEKHGLLKMKLLRDSGDLRTTQQPQISGSRTTSMALRKTSNMLHQVLAQVAEEKRIEPTSHQKQVEELLSISRGSDAAEARRAETPARTESRGTQAGSGDTQGWDLGASRPGTSQTWESVPRPSTSQTLDSVQKRETLNHFENWIDELMPAPGVHDEELDQLRQRCKSQEDEIARLVLIIDEMRARMGSLLNGGEATHQVSGLLQKVGLKEVVDAGAPGEETLPAVFRRLYQDAVQRLQRFAIIRESVKAMNHAIIAVCEHEIQGPVMGGTPPPDLEHLNATAAAALSGMWYHSDYIFKRMCDYATSQGIEAIAKARTTTLTELLAGAEDTDAAPPVSSEPAEGIHGRPLGTPPKVTLERLPGRRSGRLPRTSGHPLAGGLGASDGVDGLVAKLSRGAGDRPRSPRSRQQQLRQAQLADPEPTSFTRYMATMKEARGDMQGGEWARASPKKQAAGERPPRADAPGEGGGGPKAAHGPTGPRGPARGGPRGARSTPALPRLQSAGAAPAGRAHESP